MMKTRLGLLFWVFGVILVIVFFKLYFSAPFVEEEIENINPIQQKQLEMYVEMVKLLITLSTFLFGAIAAMFAHFYEHRKTPSSQLHLALAAIILAGLSILSGYQSYQRVIWMLQMNVFNLSQPRIAWASQFQFILFVVSAMMATVFGYRATEEDKNETPRDAGWNDRTSRGGKLRESAPE